MSYKKSIAIGLAMMYFKKVDELEDEILNKETIFNNVIRLFIAFFQIFVSFIVLLILQFVEIPIRSIIFKGTIQDKYDHWIESWIRAYEGAKKGFE
ncbi:hypothetical protein LCGC14_0884780 [marine sediment metagenome]|uniref:Uncharacterized protein n=1 Tax=marine sediment metagenome TaxID=412755 RepID=A0A0F9RKF2_9ZZZZ